MVLSEAFVHSGWLSDTCAIGLTVTGGYREERAANRPRSTRSRP